MVRGSDLLRGGGLWGVKLPLNPLRTTVFRTKIVHYYRTCTQARKVLSLFLLYRFFHIFYFNMDQRF